MLVVVRHPIGAGVSVVALLASLAFLLSMLEGGAGGVDEGDHRLEVERKAGRIHATCGGSPAPGCIGGRWRIQAHGLPASYLLGG